MSLSKRLLPIAGGVGSQQPHPHHQRQQASEDHDRERVHRGPSLNRSTPCDAILGKS